MAKKNPAPARRVPGELAPPPTPHAGYFRDTTDKLYWVPSRTNFALYRLSPDFEPVDIDSPVLTDVAEFEKQLGHQTFTRIKH